LVQIASDSISLNSPFKRLNYHKTDFIEINIETNAFYGMNLYEKRSKMLRLD